MAVLEGPGTDLANCLGDNNLSERGVGAEVCGDLLQTIWEPHVLEHVAAGEDGLSQFSDTSRKVHTVEAGLHEGHVADGSQAAPGCEDDVLQLRVVAEGLVAHLRDASWYIEDYRLRVRGVVRAHNLLTVWDD